MNIRWVKSSGAAASPSFHARQHLLRAALALSGLLSAVALPLASAAAEPAAARQIRVAAGALEEVLRRYAAEAGIQLRVAEPQQLAGLSSRGLDGRYDVASGLAALLAGTGLQASLNADGSFLIAGNAATPLQRGDLPLVRTSDSALSDSAGTTVIEGASLLLAPGGGSITEVLRTQPGVQFDKAHLSSATLGEIAAAEISINGAKPYENLLLLNGVSFGNDLNPANGGSAINSPASSSMGFNLDASLVCRLSVYDANIGVEYGGFGGGVVSARTCAPARALSGEVSIEHTSSDWTHYKIHPNAEASFEQSATAAAQPAFDKWTYRTTVEGRPAAALGLRAAVVSKRSEIPLAGYTSGLQSAADENRKVQTRRDDSLLMEAFWKLSPTQDLKLDLTHAPGQDRYFIQNARNSYYENQRKHTQVSGELEQRLAGGTKLTHTLAIGETGSSRDAESNVWKLWRYSSEKNWGNPSGNSGEGGYGDVEEERRSAYYKLKAEAAPRQWLGLNHALSAGAELEGKTWSYERLTGYEQYTGSTATTSCNLAAGGVDTALCSLATPYNVSSGGQFLASRIVYKAGYFDLENNSAALFVQDELRFDRVRLRLGLRYDDSTMAPKASLAPRSKLLWDLWGDGHSEIELGANRYYGSNYAIFYSFVERMSLQSSSQTRRLSGGLIGAWADPVFGSTASMYHVGELDLPRSDELVAAFSQVAADARWTAKFVQRKKSREVVLHLRGVGDYWWDNVGRSEAQTLSLIGKSLRPIEWAGSRTGFTVKAEHQKVNASNQDYADTLSSYAGELDKIISYDGEFIRYIDRPAENYNRPWSLSLEAETQIPAWRLTLLNRLYVRDSYQKIAATGKTVDYNGTAVAEYARTSFGRAVTWDIAAEWRLPTLAGQEAFVKLTIENLLDRTNTIEATSTSASYEKGRQFWVQTGYRF